VHHLFFEWAVAQQIWVNISECLAIELGNSFESIGKLWLSNKKNIVANMFTSAALWGLWKLRNHLCFQNERWDEWSADKDSNLGTQLEAAVTWPELARARIQAEQAKWLSKTTR
jgi:hypothetical protein